MWKKFRNIAYLAFVVLFIVIGFMIMFRTKIGGQNAVTAQQAIPSIIVSLLLVTFSYAIAGLLIDLMYLSMFMIAGIFNGTGYRGGDIISYDIFNLAGEMFNAGKNSFGVGGNIIETVLTAASGSTLLGTIGGIFGGITLVLVLAIAMLIATFKLFIELLKSYSAIVLNVVAAPIILMTGAIPGKNPFMGWFKGMVGNLAAFPTVLLMLVMYKEFVENASGAGGFVPPFTLQSGASGVIGSIMGLAIMLALPEIVKKVKDTIGAGEGIGMELGKAAWDRAAGKSGSGLSGARYAINAQPFGLNQGFPWRTEGTESGLERLLIGTRSQRQREFDKQEQARIWGKPYERQQGGLVGIVQSWRGSLGKSKQQTGSGAGSTVSQTRGPMPRSGGSSTGLRKSRVGRPKTP